MLDLYILESCPYCKKVMDYCKTNSIKFHKFDIINKDNLEKLTLLGGKEQVPFLYNEETQEKLYESEEIINYLEKILKNNKK